MASRVLTGVCVVAASIVFSLQAGDDTPLIRRTAGVNIKPTRENLSGATLDFQLAVDFPGFGDGGGARVAENPCGSGCRLSLFTPIDIGVGVGAGIQGEPDMLTADVGIVRFARNGQTSSPPSDWLIIMEDGDGLVGPMTVPAGPDGRPEYPGELTLGGKMIITVQVDDAEPMRLRSRKEPIFEGSVPGWPPYGMQLDLVNGPIPYFMEDQVDDPQAVPPFIVTENTVTLGEGPNEFFAVTPRLQARVIEEAGEIGGVMLGWSPDSQEVQSCENVDTYHVYRNFTPGNPRGWEKFQTVPIAQGSLFDPEYDGQTSVEYVVMHAADFPFGYKYEGFYENPVLVPSTLCPEEGDTRCMDFSVDPPAGAPGLFTVQASAEDLGGDTPLYTFRANDGVHKPIVIGPQEEPLAEFYLPAGDWQVAVLVDDDLGCPDRAENDTCPPKEVRVVPRPVSILERLLRNNSRLLQCLPDLDRSLRAVQRVNQNDENFLRNEFGFVALEKAPELTSVLDCLMEEEGGGQAVLWLSDPYVAIGPGGKRIGAVRIGARSSADGCEQTIEEYVVFGHILGASLSVDELSTALVSCGPVGPCEDVLVETAEVAINVEQQIGSTQTIVEGPFEVVPPCPGVRFTRGDTNNDLDTDLSDGITILNVLFLGTGELVCRAAADVDGDGDVAGTTDAIYLFNFLFLGGPPPPPPARVCGVDLTTSLDCAEHRCNSQ